MVGDSVVEPELRVGPETLARRTEPAPIYDVESLCEATASIFFIGLTVENLFLSFLVSFHAQYMAYQGMMVHEGKKA